jgi:hypothetical protein
MCDPAAAAAEAAAEAEPEPEPEPEEADSEEDEFMPGAEPLEAEEAGRRPPRT